jgi:hypothetical protein
MSEEPPERPKPDVAAQTGRIAGRLVSKLGVRLLRMKTARETLRRAHEEATRDDGGDDTPTTPAQEGKPV